MDKKVYKTYTRKFFNEEGRFINADGYEWLILKDMFNWLGRLDSRNDITTRDNDKLNRFLEDINRISDRTKCMVTSKGRKQSREVQEMWCLKLDIIPMVLTQFRPSNSKRLSTEENKEKLKEWQDLMKFINEILMELEVYKFITVDKEYQKDCMSKLAKIIPDITQNDYKTFNTNVANIMGTLIGVDIPVFKETLKIYNNQTTVDLLTVREEVLDAYLLFYETFKDYKNAQSHTLQLMKQRYPGINN